MLDALKLDIANISKDWSDLSDDIKASIVDSCKDENVLDSASAWGKKIKDAYDNFTELDESVKDFDEVEIGEKVETTLGVGSIIAKGTGLHEFAEACKMRKPNAGISMTELRKRFDDSFDVHWLIVDVAGKCFVDLYGKSHTFVNESSVDESVEAWNAATVEQRKQWLLAKNYLLADAEYNASQDFENLGVETQNFVKEFFAIDESFKDTKLVDKCPVKLGNNIIGFIEQGEPIETNIIAAEDGGALRVEVWPKGKSALKQIVVVAPNDKEWLLESEEDDDVENWWNALSTEARKAIVGDTEEDFDMSFDELSDALKEVANKAFDTSKLDESIASDNVYKNRLNDEQRELIDNFVNGDALTTNMKQLDAGMSLSEKIATVLADVVNSCKDSATADRVKANQDALTEYLAAFWQDDMICEHLIKWQPTGKHSFVNESEDGKVDAEDVNNIVDGLVDAGTLTRPQADELQDAIADSKELANIKTKGELANHVAKVADELGYDVEVDDCMSMVNEGDEGEDVIKSVLKDRAFDDFKFDCIEIDGKTMSVVMTKDGQLTGIAIEGPMTEATSADLSTMLKAYLESANTDEALVSIKKRIRAIEIDESKLCKLYDAKGAAVIDESLIEPDATPLWQTAMPAAYKLIVESLTDDQKQLLATQAAARTFVNESDVATFYRTRNWSQIKAYAGNGKPGFVNESMQTVVSRFTAEQQALIDAIRG